MRPYPCICKEAIFGFEPMTNKSQGTTLPLHQGSSSIIRLALK